MSECWNTGILDENSKIELDHYSITPILHYSISSKGGGSPDE
jgi:hypothetical protein